MGVKRLLTNLCSTDLEQSKLFYTSLLNFIVNFDSDWFVQLVSSGRDLEIGIILDGHEIVPDQVKGKVNGFYLTFVVDDVDELFVKAQELNYKIIQTPKLTPYGQKRMLVEAPEGTVCDISSPAKSF